MKLLALFLIPTLVFASDQQTSSLSTVFGDQTTAPIAKPNAQIPGDKVVPPIDSAKIDDIVQKARASWADQMKQKELKAPAAPTENLPIEETPIVSEDDDEEPIEPREKPVSKPNVVSWDEITPKRPKVVRFTEEIRGQSITIFNGNLNTKEEDTITLPSGSHAFGRVKFGEEVTADGESEIMAELDYAFLGPNQSIVEMNGCIVWLRVKSNFHTQRVNGQLRDMTCTMPNGRVFTVGLEGPLVSAANGYAGSESDLIMRGPAKAAALKFLGEITSAYGAATSAAQVTTDVLTSGEKNVEKSTNITGDKNKYVGGKVIEANGDFLKYISSFFQSMQPTLALPPGTKIHIVNRYNIKIPKIFFKIKEPIHE
jgi:hypothetical protein